MIEKLDSYAPTKEAIAGVKRALMNAGIAPEAIPDEWLPAIIAATSKWIRTTEDGLAHASRLLHFELKKGSDDLVYEIIDDVRGTVVAVPSDTVWLYTGCIVNRVPIPSSILAVSERAREQCDGCGIVSHCLKPALDPYADALKQLCNYCLIHHDHPKVYEVGNQRICQDCTVTRCHHHLSQHKKLSLG